MAGNMETHQLGMGIWKHTMRMGKWDEGKLVTDTDTGRVPCDDKAETGVIQLQTKESKGLLANSRS